VVIEIIVLITTVLFGEIDGDWMKKKKNEIICHHLHQYFYILLGGYFHCGINRQFGKGKDLCKIDFAQNKCICCKTANEVCSAIWMGRQEWISSSLFQRPDVF
jgi:hypothetical protein